MLSRFIASALLAPIVPSLLILGAAKADPAAVSNETTGSVPEQRHQAEIFSFSETQARSRIEAMGLSKIGPLVRDKGGAWRGAATFGARRVTVSLDMHGNVVAKPDADLN